jgi:hypothetical protein
MGWLPAVFQGLFFLATGLAILKRRGIAVTLVWAVTVLNGLGVIVRGFVPLDVALWLAQLGIAIWFAGKKPLLSS